MKFWALVLLIGVNFIVGTAFAASIDDLILPNPGHSQYNLTYRGIVERSEMVFLNGKYLHRFDDYLINYDFGLISLEIPLRSSDYLRVYYQTADGKSVKNSGLTIPQFDVSLYSSNTNNFTVKTSSSGGDSLGLSPTIGWQTKSQLFNNWNAVGNVWFSPNTEKMSDISTNRAGINIGAVGNVGAAKVDLAYQNAGAALTRPDLVGLKPGELFRVGVNVDNKTYQAGIKYIDSEPGNSGASSRSIDAGLKLNGGKSLTFDGAYNAKWNENGADISSSKICSLWKMTKTDFMAVNWGQVYVPDSGKTDTDWGVTAKYQFATVKGAYKLIDNCDAGKTVQANVQGDIVVSPWVRLSGNLTEINGSSYMNSSGGKAIIGPGNLWLLQLGYNRLDNVSVIETRTVEANLSPSPAIDFSGRGARYYVDRHYMPDSLSLSARLKPARFMAVYGNYIDRPDDTGLPSDSLRRSVGAEFLLGRLNFKAGYRWEEDFTAATERWGYEVGGKYNFTKQSWLSLDYNRDLNETSDIYGSSNYKLKLTHRTGFVDFSLEGRLKQYDKNGSLIDDQTEYDARAALTLKF